jgi:hypothetical protein
MKYFRPNPRRVGIPFGILGLLFAIHALLPPIEVWVVLLHIVGLSLGYLCYVLLVRHTYFVIDGGSIDVVLGHFNRKKYQIERITDIYKRYIYAGRALVFKYRDEDENEKVVTIDDALYDEKTIVGLLRTLLEINPNIKIDKDVQKLLEQRKDKKAA